MASGGEAGLLAFDLERLRRLGLGLGLVSVGFRAPTLTLIPALTLTLTRLGGSVLSAFPMLSGPRDGDPREL